MEAKRQREEQIARTAAKASKERAVKVAQSQREQIEELASRDAEAERLRKEARRVERELAKFEAEQVNWTPPFLLDDDDFQFQLL